MIKHEPKPQNRALNILFTIIPLTYAGYCYIFKPLHLKRNSCHALVLLIIRLMIALSLPAAV